MRVLLVEDEVELAATVRDGLTGEGIAIDVMHTGPEGLWAATEPTRPRVPGYEVSSDTTGV